MPGFPSYTGSMPLTQQEGWEEARNLATQIKGECNKQISAASGTVGSQSILVFCSFLGSTNTQLIQCGAVPGIASYAQAQANNPSLDVAGDFNNMQAAVAATIAWIRANYPQDVNGNLLDRQLTVNGQITTISFTAQQLTGFVTQLQALLATID